MAQERLSEALTGREVICYANYVAPESPQHALGNTAVRLARSVYTALSTVELSAAQYRLLVQLAEGSEASTSLAKKLAVTAPSVTAVVDGLVQRGLVERSQSAEDRRRVSLTLTEEGQRVLSLADQAVTNRLALIAAELGGGQRTKSALDGLALWGEALSAFRARRKESQLAVPAGADR